MKISARNRLTGTVQEVKTGAVNSEVILSLPGGQSVAAIVTNESMETLGLAKGKEAVALIKASLVLVMTDDSGLKLSARNCLAGTVKSLTVGPVSAEVCIELPGGTQVWSTITKRAVDELGLTEGAGASAVFKAPSVILAVPV